MTTPDPGLAAGQGWNLAAGIPEDEIGLLTRVVRLNLLVSRVLEDLTDPHGITLSDFLVLATMRRGVSSPVELCRVLGRTTGGMSLTLDRLVSAGWVGRTPDPTDRRRVVVELTDQGRAKAEAVNQALHDWEDRLGLHPAGRAEVETQLDGLCDLVVNGST